MEGREHTRTGGWRNLAGGTNPSLLEALANTNVNILYDVSYNKEVGQESCFYFNKQENNLKKIIMKVDKLTEKEQKKYGDLAKQRIHESYTWPLIANQYIELFAKLLTKN